MEHYIASGPSAYLGVESEHTVTRVLDMTLQGMRVLRVARNSPAEKAGIRAGDIITGADGVSVDDGNAGLNFVKALASNKPGDTVVIEVFRGGEYLQLPAVLAVGEPTFTLSERSLLEDEPEEAGLNSPDAPPVIN